MITAFRGVIPVCASCRELVPVDHRGAPVPVRGLGPEDFCSRTCLEQWEEDCEHAELDRAIHWGRFVAAELGQ